MHIICTKCNLKILTRDVIYALPCGHLFHLQCKNINVASWCTMCKLAFPSDKGIRIATSSLDANTSSGATRNNSSKVVSNETQSAKLKDAENQLEEFASEIEELEDSVREQQMEIDTIKATNSKYNTLDYEEEKELKALKKMMTLPLQETLRSGISKYRSLITKIDEMKNKLRLCEEEIRKKSVK